MSRGTACRRAAARLPPGDGREPLRRSPSPGRKSPPPRGRPTATSGHAARIRIVATARQQRPELFGHERHERVEQPQHVVEAESATSCATASPVAQALLDRLEVPVAELVPCERVGGGHRVLELEALDACGHRCVRVDKPRQDPAVLDALVTRGVGGAAGAVSGDVRAPAGSRSTACCRSAGSPRRGSRRNARPGSTSRPTRPTRAPRRCRTCRSARAGRRRCRATSTCAARRPPAPGSGWRRRRTEPRP